MQLGFNKSLSIVVSLTLAICPVNTAFAQDGTEVSSIVSQSGSAPRETSDTIFQKEESTATTDAAPPCANSPECEEGPISGADAPVSPTDSSTHLDITAEDILSEDELAAAYSKLMQRSAWDYSNATFADIIVYAEQYIGTEYVWGGKDWNRDGGFDCSGFVNWVYNHVAGMGIDSDYTNAASLYKYCTPVSEADAQPGDIVFWKGTYSNINYISHVGIYCGNGIALDAGDPIGYDRVDSIKNMYGNTAERVYGRLVTLNSSPTSLNASNVLVHVPDQIYTGGELTPKVTITYAGNTLIEGRDYNVSYIDNVSTGTATAYIDGIGSYTGTVAATFEVYAPTLADGTYKIAAAEENSLVIDIPGASKSTGASIQLYKSNGTFAQAFTVQKTSDGFYTIRNENSGKYLSLIVDPRSYGTANSIAQDIYSDDAYHKWSIRLSSSGDYVISSALDGQYVFDIAGGNLSNCTSVRSYLSNGTAAQRWSFSASESMRERLDELAAANAGTVAAGTYRICSSIDKTAVLDAEGASKADGTKVQAYESNGTDAQLWRADADDAGYITLINVNSGKALDVAGGESASGTAVQLYEPNGTWAQKWVAVADGASVKLVSALDDSMCLDLSGGSSSNGTGAQIYLSNGTAAQRWSFSASESMRERLDELAAANAGTVAAGTYRICSSIDKTAVLDAEGASKADGTKVQAYESNGTDAQLWRADADDAGYITLINVNSGKALDVAGGESASGTAVQLYEPNGTWAQKWVAVADGASVKLVSALDDSMCLDLSGGSSSNGTGAQIYANNDTNAQRWNFAQPACPKTLDDGNYVFKNGLNQSFAMDVEGASTSENANVQLYEVNNTNAQIYHVKWEYGFYYISNVNSGRFITIDSNTYNVQQTTLAQSDDYAWKLSSNFDGSYVFTHASTGLTLGAVSNGAANGVNISGANASGVADDWLLEKKSSVIYVDMNVSLDEFANMNDAINSASYSDIRNALDPENYSVSSNEYCMFIDCRGYTGTVTADQINQMIENTSSGRSGVFRGQGQAILNAARKAGINEMYFMAHMMIETGWGTSQMARGKWYIDGTYYNFIGWGAFDSNPDSAYDYARDYGWNSISAALDGAAEKLSKFYIYAGQETVYEMRWNPDKGSVECTHQYCTSITWAKSIAQTMGYNYVKFVGPISKMNASYIVPVYE